MSRGCLVGLKLSGFLVVGHQPTHQASPWLPCYMPYHHLVAAALMLAGCTIPTYDLDAIVIHGQPEAVDILSAAVMRLGGRVGETGRGVEVDDQQAYCVVADTYSTLAITTERNIHLCEAWWRIDAAMRRRSLWHELGHVFGAKHSLSPQDLMYAIPRASVNDYTETDISQICESGLVSGGLCD